MENRKIFFKSAELSAANFQPRIHQTWFTFQNRFNSNSSLFAKSSSEETKSHHVQIFCLAIFALLALLISGCSDSGKTVKSRQGIKRAAFAHFGPDIVAENVISGYKDGLKSGGYFEGQNIEFVIKHASGEIANIPTMLQSLESQNFDLIIPMTTPVLSAAATAIKKTPAVFVYTYDPLAAGVGKNFNDHLPNFTGVGSFPPIEETMKFMIELFPNAKKFGVIYNASEVNSTRAVVVARQFLSSKNIKLEEATLTGTNEIYQAAVSVFNRGIDAFWAVGDNTVFQAFEAVVKAAAAAKKPVIINDIEFVDKGALAGIGISWYNSGFAAGKIAVEVLNGANPAKIPIINVAERKIVLNNEIANKLNIHFPQSIIKESEKSR